MVGIVNDDIQQKMATGQNKRIGNVNGREKEPNKKDPKYDTENMSCHGFSTQWKMICEVRSYIDKCQVHEADKNCE